MSSNNFPNDKDGPSSSLPLHSRGAPKAESAGVKSPSPVPSRYVYRDFSRVVPDDGESVLEAITKVPPTNAKHQKLPLKLSAMLEDPEFSHIISWMPHGRSWRILKPKAFVKEVLPKHFDYCNYNSFVRLVNAWGFRRFTSGPDRNSYYHELFLRGLPHLHNKMRRVTGKEKKIPIDQEDEPDLYSISRANPLPCVSQSQGNEPSSQTTGDITTATIPPLAAKSSALQASAGPSEPTSSALRNALQDPTLDSGSLAESIAQVLEANRIMSEAQNTVNRATALPMVARSAAAPTPSQSQWTTALGNSLASLSQVAASQAQVQQQQQQSQQMAVLPQQAALSAQQQQFALAAQQQQLPLQQVPIVPQQFVTYGALPAATGGAPQLGAVAPAPVLSAAPAAASVRGAPTPAPVTTADGQQLAVMYIPVYTTVAAAGAQGAIPAGVAQQQQQQVPPQVATTASQQAGGMLLPPQTQAGANHR